MQLAAGEGGTMTRFQEEYHRFYRGKLREMQAEVARAKADARLALVEAEMAKQAFRKRENSTVAIAMTPARGDLYQLVILIDPLQVAVAASRGSWMNVSSLARRTAFEAAQKIENLLVEYARNGGVDGTISPGRFRSRSGPLEWHDGQ